MQGLAIIRAPRLQALDNSMPCISSGRRCVCAVVLSLSHRSLDLQANYDQVEGRLCGTREIETQSAAWAAIVRVE